MYVALLQPLYDPASTKILLPCMKPLGEHGPRGYLLKLGSLATKPLNTFLSVQVPMLLMQRHSARTRLRGFFLDRSAPKPLWIFIRRILLPCIKLLGEALASRALNDRRITSALPEAVGRCKPA